MKCPMRAFAITGIETASSISRMMRMEAIRATPPSFRMSAGTRSSAITAAAPAFSAILACSTLVTSMMTPPLSISARPTFNRKSSDRYIFVLLFLDKRGSRLCRLRLFHPRVFTPEQRSQYFQPPGNLVRLQSGETQAQSVRVRTGNRKIFSRKIADIFARGPDRQIRRIQRFRQIDPDVHPALRACKPASRRKMARASGKAGFQSRRPDPQHLFEMCLQTAGFCKPQQYRLAELIGMQIARRLRFRQPGDEISRTGHPADPQSRKRDLRKATEQNRVARRIELLDRRDIVSDVAQCAIKIVFHDDCPRAPRHRENFLARIRRARRFPRIRARKFSRWRGARGQSSWKTIFMAHCATSETISRRSSSSILRATRFCSVAFRRSRFRDCGSAGWPVREISSPG